MEPRNDDGSRAGRAGLDIGVATMRRLILLRHAKSSWDNAGIRDIDRPLNKRGLRDAPEMGRRLRDRNCRPAGMFSSTANRAITTARLVANEIGVPEETIREIPELYLASPGAIVTVLAREADNYDDLIVVGHNPGMTDLANRISDATIDNLPTCGVFAVTFDCSSWSDVLRRRGTLSWFDYPKNPKRPA